MGPRGLGYYMDGRQPAGSASLDDAAGAEAAAERPAAAPKARRASGPRPEMNAISAPA